MEMGTPEQLAASNTEHGHQAALFCWIRNPPPLATYATFAECFELRKAFAIPNGEARGRGVAARLKAEGVASGVPDIFLPVQRASYGGLWIEMKRPAIKLDGKIVQKAGVLSAAQLARSSDLRYDGYKYVCCYNWCDALNEMLAYLRLD
jgi:hypothetical protein